VTSDLSFWDLRSYENVILLLIEKGVQDETIEEVSLDD